MGTTDILSYAYLGVCGKCNKRYVTSACIANDDSRVVSENGYFCPGCGGNSPISVRSMEKNEREFVVKRLNVIHKEGITRII